MSAALLLPLAGVPARAAGNLDQGELAALLVFPIITGGQPANLETSEGDVVIPGQTATTLITVTNGLSQNVTLVLDVISGDYGEDAWESDSFECALTGSETTTFVFAPASGGRSSLHGECGEIVLYNGNVVDVDTEGDEIRATTNAQNGYFVVALANANSMVMGSNALFGDTIVIDPVGQAYSFGPITFQSGNESNNGDKAYEFGREYQSFPGVLASHFVAEGPDNGVLAELILITLDGTVGRSPEPRASLVGHVYDDDENSRDFTYDFDCFDVVPLSELSNGFIHDPASGLNLQSPTGHFDLFSRSSGVSSADAHDHDWGDGNGIRNRGAHGWIVQSVDGVLLDGDSPVTGAARIVTAGQAAWGRPLMQSTTSLTPAGDDRPPVLDAR